MFHMPDLELSLHSSWSFKTGSYWDVAYLPSQIFITVYLLWSLCSIPKRWIYRQEGCPKEETRKRCKAGCPCGRPARPVSLPRLPCRGVTSHSVPFNQTFCTSTFSWGILQDKKFLSIMIISNIHKMAIWGMEEGQQVKENRFSVSLLRPSSASVCGKDLCSCAACRALHPAFSHYKMAPLSGAASPFPSELFLGPLILSIPTWGAQSCPPSFSNYPLKGTGARAPWALVMRKIKLLISNVYLIFLEM